MSICMQSKMNQVILNNPVNKKIGRLNRHNTKSSINHGVSIITVTNRLNHINQVFDNYNRQKIKRKELIIILNNNSMSLKHCKAMSKKYPNVKVFKKDESITFSECKNYAITMTKFPYISHFDDDDYYAENFLKDILETFNKVEADIIGKRSAFVYFSRNKILAIRFPRYENAYVKFVMDSSMVIKKSVFDKIKFPTMKSGADFSFQKKCLKNGFKIFSTDRYNYAFIRHKNLDNHSWKITDNELLRECSIICRTDNFIKYITK
ncbi:glycosyltransferase family A protein [Proteiniborus sp. MB09-C3]|uniref:glycosyltransferase n=1 Tax=Proteiniborus sp. MB09-C3 TaxID=3050072 RepID=UPI0025543927|nr:glycosyltransferase family A protein [Proteiniborus sp. MB09-C3]WIV11200.1 glycosyltransferase family A protein [Proteiniborus sp. MB09-C3]